MARGCRLSSESRKSGWSGLPRRQAREMLLRAEKKGGARGAHMGRAVRRSAVVEWVIWVGCASSCVRRVRACARSSGRGRAPRSDFSCRERNYEYRFLFVTAPVVVPLVPPKCLRQASDPPALARCPFWCAQAHAHRKLSFLPGASVAASLAHRYWSRPCTCRDAWPSPTGW